MRLFIALLLDERNKEDLYQIMKKIKDTSLTGNFTGKNNLHLTLVFLGETNKLPDIREVLDNLSCEPFEFSINELGKFTRKGGDILWAGVEKNKTLYTLQKDLEESLKPLGFSLQSMGFQPHITLAREFITNNLLPKITPINQKVRKISLMQSERVNGKLTYTSVYEKQL